MLPTKNSAKTAANPAFTKLADGIWKMEAGCNIYFLDNSAVGEKILIDTGSRSERKKLEFFLNKLVDFSTIKKVIFTHLHYDHIGNFDLFPNAMLLASKQEIEDFKTQPSKTVLDADIADKFKQAQTKLLPIDELKIAGLEIIPTPGHTKGSICIWMPGKKILFSGDTMMKNSLGRTDLPTSSPAAMQESVTKLVSYNFKILCPGHD